MRHLPLITLLLLVATAPLKADDSIEAREEQAMRDAVAKAAPAVVRIETVGGLERVGKVRVGHGPTTGLIVSEDGYVISSAFNFASKPASILVTLPGDRRVPAEIVARDHSRMLVLLKVKTDEKLPLPVAAPPSEIQVGQWAIALGRTFAGDKTNVSVGIVSALDRVFGKAVQTDAKISPANYGGPLIDIQGRVLGVLVPMSAQGKGGSEVAGVELYDGGIGFAVPLTGILDKLDQLKQGEDLHAGLLGISMKKGDPFGSPAEIALVPPGTPAAKAGLLAGDKVIGLDGRPIATQMQLKLAVGPRYAGETVQVTVARKDEQKLFKLELVDKIEPFSHAFLGILPERIGPGVTVRYVYPNSPAAKAGVQMGDVISEINGKKVASTLEVLDVLSGFLPGDTVPVAVDRDGERIELSLDTAALPTEVIADLPEIKRPADEEQQPIEKGLREEKLAEFKNVCQLYAPTNYRADVPSALLVWLHGPGGVDADAMLKRWQAHCDEHAILLAMPAAADENKWDRTEAEYLEELIASLADKYAVDPARTVVLGNQGGGEMAYKLGFENRTLIGGVAVVDAALPGLGRIPSNEPAERLAIFSAHAKEAPAASKIERSLQILETQRYPVTTKDLGDAPRTLNAEELQELVRWIDSLDRF
jgi:serine protease Do